MPRRQPSQISPADTRQSSPDTSLPPQHITSKRDNLVKDTTKSEQPLEALLGGNPQFADQFFGEPGNMARPLRPATPHANAGHGDMSIMSAQQDGHGVEGPSISVTSPVANSNIDVENTPISIDQLVIQQLREDLDAYRYDLDFARAQLDPANVSSISPAETRTFQLRILDLGHQMRMLNHRIQLMQATMNNARFTSGTAGRVGATTSNTYWGPYPPGTSVQPGGYGAGSGPGPITNGYYGQGIGSGMPIMQSPAGYLSYSDFPQERRGPGRPLGSKNRPRPSQESQQPTPVPPNGSVKAAALASAAASSATGLSVAGAKGDQASEIRVGTPIGDQTGSIAAADSANGEHPSKRIRLDVQVGSPISNNLEPDGRPTQNVITAANNNTSLDQEDNDEMTDDDTQFHITTATTSGRQPHVAEVMRSTPSGLAAPYGTPSAPVLPALSAGSPAYVGPAGNEFKRLGGWRCRLCTSQKYLNAPPPKQPSEPGHWPLRDISKMVTHFTRMHGEHNNVERCMELGAALGANRGPFRHWLQITKKEKGIDQEAVDVAVDELDNGRMPAVLRKVSTSAANFPRD